MDQQFLCHVLFFVFAGKVEEIIQFLYGVVNETGEYAVCHFVDQDVFLNARPEDFLYGQGNHTSYRTNENCALVRGWAKHTSESNRNAIARRKLCPTQIMIPVSDIISTCVGIEDSLNTIPHSYIFLPPSKNWPDLFNTRMTELMQVEGENFLDHYEETDEAQADEQLDDDKD